MKSTSKSWVYVLSIPGSPEHKPQQIAFKYYGVLTEYVKKHRIPYYSVCCLLQINTYDAIDE